MKNNKAIEISEITAKSCSLDKYSVAFKHRHVPLIALGSMVVIFNCEVVYLNSWLCLIAFILKLAY